MATISKITQDLRKSSQSSALNNRKLTAEQLVSISNVSMADYIEIATIETDNIKTNLKGVSSSVKDISTILHNINKILAIKNNEVPPTPTVVENAPASPEARPEGRVTPPSENANRITDTLTEVINRVTPRSIRESEARSEKSGFIANISKKIKIWNSEAAREAMNDKWSKTSVIGKLANAAFAGLKESPFAQSKIIKFLFSPAGILLIYTLGKLFKVKIWDKYVAPAIQWWKEKISPMIESLGGYLKDIQTWFYKNSVSFDEIKNKYNTFMTDWNDKNSTIWTKLGSFLTLTDTVLAPITNPIKLGFAWIMQKLAEIFDFLGMKKAASSALISSSSLIDTMYGEEKNIQKRKLLKSTIGNKYTAAIDEDAAKALNKKIQMGSALSSEEKAISKSGAYVDKYGEEALDNRTKNIKDYQDFLQDRIRRAEQQAFLKKIPYDKDKAIIDARKAYDNQSKNNLPALLNEISMKNFKDSNEAAKYIKEILVMNKNLSKSADDQNEVILAIRDNLNQNDKNSAATQKAINDLAVNAFQLKQNNIQIFNEGEANIRRENDLKNINYGYGPKY